MILLNSIWLFALAALSIPVAIHLWNIRPGKTLKVGSIALMNESAQKSSRSLKLHDLLLLLLRCLLLALVALILAIPIWQKQMSASVIRGWLLLPKENLKESYQKFKPEIDSLSKAGYEFHFFNKGFQKGEMNKALADGKRPTDSLNSASYWTLIQHLDKQVPSSLPVYLFTPNTVTHFKGEKPQVALNLHWQTYSSADSTATWVDRAWLTNDNDIVVVQGNSKPGGTGYTNYTIQSGNRQAPFIINTENGRLTVSRKDSSPVAVDTSTWRFAIYAEKGNADAGYVNAGLRSIIQFTKHKAVVTQYDDANKIQAHQNWLFWLSSKTADERLVTGADNFFMEEDGKIKDVNSWINGGQSLSSQKIALYKRITADNAKGETLWSDGFGNMVLSSEKQQQTTVYHFYSRFYPAWSDLVWNDNFPKMLLKLIVDPPAELKGKYDRRAIDIKQLVPATNNTAHTTTDKITEQISLSRYCWLLLMLIFIAERWLAYKKASQTAIKRRLQNG